MADLQPTDRFLVNRSNSTKTVASADLMAQLQDDDLMLVNRANVTRKITGKDLKDSVKSPLALGVTLTTYNPQVGTEITAVPLRSGGEAPFTFTYQWLRDGLSIPGETSAVYTAAQADVGLTLKCQVTVVDGAGDTVSASSPSTAAVQQGVIAPVIDQVTLAEQNPNNDPRFTDQKFDANVICTPASSTPIVYGLKAKVAGDLTITPQTSEITQTSLTDGGTLLTFADSEGLSNFEPGDVVRQDDATFDGTIYSDYSNFGDNPKNLFDGVLGFENRTQINAASDTYYTVLDGVSIPCSAAIRFNYQAVAGQGRMTIRINGTEEVTGGNASSYYGWGPYMPFIGTINKLEWKLANGQQAGLAGIEVDGNVLVDGTGWTPGGTVGSVSVEQKTIQLSTSTNGWSPSTGNYVLGDQKTIQNATQWLGLEVDGTVRRNLLAEEPAYTIYKTVGGLSAPLTLTFPSTFADGDQPDNDLPAGTTLTVYGKVGNDAGAFPPGQTKVGASVTPSVIPGPENVEMYGLRFSPDRNTTLVGPAGSGNGTTSFWRKNEDTNWQWEHTYDNNRPYPQTISDGNYDGYFSDVYWCEGNIPQSAFGATINGNFAPYDPVLVKANIAAAGGFGAAGFHLMFDPTKDTGHDDSGNGNDFTATNFLVGYTAQVWSASSAADELGFDGTTTYQSGATRLVGSANDFEIVAAEQPFTDVTAVVIGTSDTVARVLLDDVLYAATYQSGTGMIVTSPSPSFSSIKISGTSSGIQLAYVRINGKLLINSNLSDNVKDTPMLNYATLADGKEGNLEATANGTSLTYLGKAGTLYYYEEDSEGKGHEGGTAFSSSNGKTYNFGQQEFANQYNADQVWSAGTTTGSTYPDTGWDKAFDGQTGLSGYAQANAANTTLTLANPVPFTTLKVSGGLGAGSQLKLNGVIHTITAGYVLEEVTGVTSPLTTIDLVNTNQTLAAIEADGKVLVDAVNGSYTWSNFWTGDVVAPENSFDGDLATKTELSGSNKTITWTPGTPVSAASGIRIRASKYTGGNDNNLMEVNGSPVGITATSPAWYDVPGDTLTSIAMKDIGSNQGWIHAVEVNGLLLVDSSKAGIAGAVGNELKRTWTEWNNLVTLRAENPDDVATFEAIKCCMEKYPDDVTRHREDMANKLRAANLDVDQVSAAFGN